MNCRTIISKRIAREFAALLLKTCSPRRANIWTPRTCKSSLSATARRSARKPRSLANSKFTTPRVSDWSKPLNEEDTERADTFDDEIKPEDGRLRYWMFFNGEEYRLFAALAAAFFGMSGVVYTFLGRGKVFSEPSCLYWRCSVLAAGDCSTAKRGGSKRPAGKRNHPEKKELRFAWPLDFGRLFS